MTAGAPVLKDINLVIEPGTSLGIIGPTGSGKSTLVSLLPRLFPVETGQLFIDDIDINRWPLSVLRRGIGFVPQETFLFSDTLAANVTFGGETAAGMGVERSPLAALHDEVTTFPNQYETFENASPSPAAET
jgi:ATP-binding cassette subfamily B protein